MEFTEDHAMFRKTVRDVVEREINPHVDEWEAAGSSRPTTCSPSWAPWVCSASSTTRPTAGKAPTTRTP